jgi:hypothetical protein
MRQKLVRSIYQCLTCGQSFYSWSDLDYSYGTYVLYTLQGDIGWWDVLHEPVFKELSAIVSRVVGRSDNLAAFRAAWTLCCDKAPNGSAFVLRPFCPYDQSADVKFMDKPEPFVFANVEVIRITHHDWKQLSEEQKTGLVANELKQRKFVEG